MPALTQDNVLLWLHGRRLGLVGDGRHPKAADDADEHKESAERHDITSSTIGVGVPPFGHETRRLPPWRPRAV